MIKFHLINLKEGMLKFIFVKSNIENANFQYYYFLQIPIFQL